MQRRLAILLAVFLGGCVEHSQPNGPTSPPLAQVTIGTGQFTIEIDATDLTIAEVSLSGVGSFSTDAVAEAALDAGTYLLFYVSSGPPGGGAFFGSVTFRVLADGSVDFDPSLQGVLDGRGTRLLRVHGVAITVDARALTITPTFGIPFGIGAVIEFVDAGSKVAEVNLLPGRHAVNYRSSNRPGGGAFQPIVFFDVFANGTVDFDPSLNGVLVGRGTNTLTVRGRDITVDARALTMTPRFGIPFSIGFVLEFVDAPSKLANITVLPGTHVVGYRSSNMPGGGAFHPLAFFDVSLDGTVDFDPALNRVFAGRGTSTLTVTGLTVTVDARALTMTPRFGIPFSIGFVLEFVDAPSKLANITVLPGTHVVNYRSSNMPGGGAFEPLAFFDVSLDGTVDFDPALNRVFAGRGTSTLTVTGLTVTVDARALTIEPQLGTPFAVGFVLEFVDIGSKIADVTLLPGTHVVNYRSSLQPGGGAFEPLAFFDVSPDGTVDFDPSLDPVFDGRGTASLLVKGARIRVDATALTSSSFELGFLGSFSNDAMRDAVVLPGIHAFAAADFSTFFFDVPASAALNYDPSLDCCVSGRGTNTLIVWGSGISTPAARIGVIIAQVEDFRDRGLLSKPNPMLALLANAQRLISDGKNAPATANLLNFIRLVNDDPILPPLEKDMLVLKAQAVISEIAL